MTSPVRINLCLPALPSQWNATSAEASIGSSVATVRFVDCAGDFRRSQVDLAKRKLLDAVGFPVEQNVIDKICDTITYALATLSPLAPEPKQRVAIIVTGNRAWTDRDMIRADLSRFPAGSLLVHGASPIEAGADWIAHDLGVELGFIVLPFPVITRIDGEWPSAGPKRSARMVASVVELLRNGNLDSVHGFAYAVKGRTNRGTFACAKVMKTYGEIEFSGRWDRHT